MVKFYAWEPAFRSAVMENRQQEANILRRLAFWQVRQRARETTGNTLR